mmetsp:Transcript_116928/g.206850  ORF Transcript_116928/g.206850 Transcript_116928/m.206850 type:complete len:264 (+) Transcript_116928:84-875(+)
MGCFPCVPKAPLRDLPSNVVEVNVKDPAQFEEAAAVMTRSFAGSESTPPEGSMDWTLGPLFSEKWTDPQRAELMSYFMKVTLYTDGRSKNGRVLAVRTKDGEGFGAVIAFQYHLKGFKGESFMENMPALMKMGLPPYLKEPLKSNGGKGIDVRCSALGMVEEIHKKYASKPHIYVNTVAVDPAQQGQGLCSPLMRLVSKLADEKGLMCFLQAAGEKNPAIYQRYGYEIVGQGELSCKNDPDNSGPVPVSAMIRPAKEQRKAET